MKIFGYSVEECLTFFMLVVVGYFIAKLFSQKCNGFSVGAQIECDKIINPVMCNRFSSCKLDGGKCTDINAPAPAPAPVPASGKKMNGSDCTKNNECQSGVCHNEKGLMVGTCRNCSDVNDFTCTSNPSDTVIADIKGHGDVCVKDHNKKCQYRPCSVRPNKVNNCKEKNNKESECHNSRNKNNELCWFNNNQCSNKKKKEIFKCKPQ